ncbi:Alginate lyase [Variovorax sp. CF079]|nr:LamG-like jellyroll fold domain-containing protein [Variovorax sp. CF079]SDD08420.1 Alginate lyase [Variovorax sp. CF079]
MLLAVTYPAHNNAKSNVDQPKNDNDISLDRRLFCVGAVSFAALGTAACGDGGSSGFGSAGALGTTQQNAATSTATSTEVAATEPVTNSTLTSQARKFTHPGLLHTEADFERMRTKIAAGAQPWVDGWNALTSSSRAQLGRAPVPLATVVRGGDGENHRTMVEDMARAYQFALRWKVSGNTAYADLAVQYLDAWSSTMTALNGNSDRFLAAGIYGYQWANAAEMMRSYPGWSSEGVARFQKLLLEVFYPLSHSFLIKHNDANITNYWANWDLCAICAILAIGVFCDRTDLYDEAIAYYKTGRGNGAAAHNVYMLHPGYLGQWQESGRDQGHATLGMALTGLLCEMAWSQGEDLYGYGNNRFLAAAEYVAMSNLQDGNGQYYSPPFSTYVNRQGTFTVVSTAGQPNLRPCWESIYNHYVNRKGLAAPWVATIAAQIRPERSEWGGDQPSFGTLTYSRDPVAAGTPPSGLTAYVTANQVLLSWWGSAGATSYKVKRGPSANGPFATVASVTDPRTYTDTPGNGVWHYVVTAVSASGESSVSNVARVALPSELRAQLPLDAASGTTAADGSGNGQNGTLQGGASWGEGRSGGRALALDGSSGHLALPTGVLSSLGDFTIALWVYWNAAVTNTRVFDFGSSDIAYLALLPRDAGGSMRFTVTGTTWYGEQSIVASALPTGRWVHLAVTLSGTTGTLYVDGVAAGSNNAIALAPFQLGDTTQNWLGRSQYPADPCFNGRMQDLRIYSGALSAAEIAALAA